MGDESHQDGGSFLVLADPPVIKRLKGTLFTLQSFIQENGTGGIAKLSFLMTTITDELIDELSEYDEATMQIFLAQIGAIIGWIGHGDNSAIPEQLRPFAEMVQPTMPTEDEVTEIVNELSA